MLGLIDSKRMRIVEFFLENPTEEIHLRALARRLKVSPTWIGKNLKSLAGASLLTVKKDKERKSTNIKADRDKANFKRLKVSFNLYKLYKSGLLDELVEGYGKPEGIVLFGSYSKGEDTEESDIDIAVITSKEVRKDWSNFEKKLKRKVKVMELKKGKIEEEFMNTLANGIVLYGYLDVRK